MLRSSILLFVFCLCQTRVDSTPAKQPAKCSICEIKDILTKMDKRLSAIEKRLNPSATIGKIYLINYAYAMVFNQRYTISHLKMNPETIR